MSRPLAAGLRHVACPPRAAAGRRAAGVANDVSSARWTPPAHHAGPAGGQGERKRSFSICGVGAKRNASCYESSFLLHTRNNTAVATRSTSKLPVASRPSALGRSSAPSFSAQAQSRSFSTTYIASVDPATELRRCSNSNTSLSKLTSNARFAKSSIALLSTPRSKFRKPDPSLVRYCSSRVQLARGKMADRDILPDSFVPSHYDLVIKDLDLKNWTYNGSVTIQGKVAEPLKEITLNTLELDIHKVELNAQGNSATASDTTYDAKQQRTTIAFAETIPASDASLIITFSGKLNADLAGFYRSKYKPPVPAAASVGRDDEFHYMLSTQFEACDARRAFPCFDEPALKATFDFAIEIPDDQVAISNMPVKKEAPTSSGKKMVSFERSPIMSTYLLAWAVGDFEYIEAFTDRKYNGKQIPVRVYTTRGLKEQGQFALDHAPKYIDFFSEKFEIDYPLPKSDILAVHEFTHGAMENWGLVTYRVSAILFDEGRSEARFRNRIAYVVAHELAHQWFGNLCTPAWWDELWLNEGFATWAGWLATESLHPEWDVWAQFVNEGMETSLKLDSIRSSHPIHVPVRDALDVNQIFDAISYLKGCSVIRMLANHLGIETFLKGVAKYLNKNQYSNAKTVDLWNALSEVSGQDVNALMDPWIGKIGFPVVTVSEKPGKITVSQRRFLSTGDVKAEDDTTTWWVPLGLTGKTGTKGIEAIALKQKEDVIDNVDEDFYKINTDATGFYRVNYPPQRLAKLGTQLDRLSNEDKISIAGSAAELAFSGEGTTAALLSFLQGFNNEMHYRVMSQALDSISIIKGIFGEDEVIRKGLSAFTLKLIEKPLKSVGWDVSKDEDFNLSLLRKRLLLTAVVNGNDTIADQAAARFTAWVADPAGAPIPADLRQPIYRAALKADPFKAVPTLCKEWSTTVSPDGKEVCLLALGHTSDEDLIKSSLIPFLFNTSKSEGVTTSDVHILSNSLAHNRVGRELQWNFIKENWDQVLEKMGNNPIMLDRLVKVSLQQFVSHDKVKEIETFFEGKDTGAFNRTLEQVKDKISGRAAYRERETEALRQWLVQKGYATA